MSVHLIVGQAAPPIELVDQSNNHVSLAAHKGHKVMVYFYPKANTPGCTMQSCGLRDIKNDVGDTVILGISPDPVEKQAKFDEKYGLGFPLLSDTEHVVSEAYGVWEEKSMFGKKYMGINRSAFLVDENGMLEKVWYKASPNSTPKNLLSALKASQ